MKKNAVLLSVVLITACAGDKKNEDYAYKIVLVEQERFVEPYKTRIIVTKDFVRYDDGVGDPNFVLFDRKQNIIYSVNAGDRNVIAVHKKETILEPPFEMDVKVKKIGAMKDAPKLEGKSAIHYQILVNDKPCYNIATISNLMPEAIEAFQDYAKIAASDSMKTYNNIPADMRDPCEGAITTFSPLIHLQHGFPVMEWGRQRQIAKQLYDYDLEYLVDPSEFVLPQAPEFRHFRIQEMREGKVSFTAE